MTARKLYASMLALAFACSSASFAQETAETPTPAPTTIAELKSAIEALVEERDLPAVGIAMVDENGPVWVDAIGRANIENNVAADADTMFRIGSTSKMFVSLAVLKLVEEGRLSLDDTLAEHAPDIEFDNPWEDTDPILISHLLEHTTGWDDMHLPEYGLNDPTPMALKAALDFHPHSRTSRWKPGTRMSYCNNGPPVAAYVVQQITGMEFEEYIAKNFFAPMGMQTASYRLSPTVEEKGVTSYNNGNQPQDYWHISVRPSGSINASPRDMANMVGFFVNRGQANGVALVSEASLQRMETPATSSAALAGQVYGYGLSNYSSPHKNWVYREHNGGVNGGITELAYLPEASLGHVIMVNSGDGRSFRDISNLVRDFETRNLAHDDVARDMPVTARHRSVAGLYYPINPRQQLGYFLERVLNIQKLWVEDDVLLRKGLLGGDMVRYLPADEALWKSEDTGVIALSQVTDPLAGAVVHSGSLVLKPASPWLIYGQLAIVALWLLMIVTSLLFLPVWGIRKLRGKIPSGAPTRIRVWPLLAGASIVGVNILTNIAGANPFETLAAPTVYSVSIMLLTIAFAGFALLGFGTTMTTRSSDMNRWAYWHSSIASTVHVIVAIYFLWFGVIGLMTWT